MKTAHLCDLLNSLVTRERTVIIVNNINKQYKFDTGLNNKLFEIKC